MLYVSHVRVQKHFSQEGTGKSAFIQFLSYENSENMMVFPRTLFASLEEESVKALQNSGTLIFLQNKAPSSSGGT